MTPFRRRRREPVPAGPPPEDLVREYLRAQNLEQLGRTDEAVAHYERAVDGAFDAAGPYDRLIAIYEGREAYADVVRVCDRALQTVKTFDDKRAWYEHRREAAARAAQDRPDPQGAEF